MTLLKFLLVVPLLSFSFPLSADPIDVTYTVSGSPGDWTFLTVLLSVTFALRKRIV